MKEEDDDSGDDSGDDSSSDYSRTSDHSLFCCLSRYSCCMVVLLVHKAICS